MNLLMIPKEDLLLKIKKLTAENTLLRKRIAEYEIEKGKEMSYVDEVKYRCEKMMKKYRDKIANQREHIKGLENRQNKV